MKIKKEFIPLISNKTKEYEFRNSYEHFDKYYSIKDEYFYLKEMTNYSFYSKKEFLKSLKIDANNNYYFSTYEITKEDYEWILNNLEYFFVKNFKKFYVCVGGWKKQEFEELEIIE